MEPGIESKGRTPRKPYPAELRERSVRMVVEHRRDYESEQQAIRSIASKMGMHYDTLRKWVNQARTDGGVRAGLTTDERERMKQLEREIRELRRANEILKSASVFFATELDGRRPT
jgi:transposase